MGQVTTCTGQRLRTSPCGWTSPGKGTQSTTLRPSRTATFTASTIERRRAVLEGRLPRNAPRGSVTRRAKTASTGKNRSSGCSLSTDRRTTISYGMARERIISRRSRTRTPRPGPRRDTRLSDTGSGLPGRGCSIPLWRRYSLVARLRKPVITKGEPTRRTWRSGIPSGVSTGNTIATSAKAETFVRAHRKISSIGRSPSFSLLHAGTCQRALHEPDLAVFPHPDLFLGFPTRYVNRGWTKAAEALPRPEYPTSAGRSRPGKGPRSPTRCS